MGMMECVAHRYKMSLAEKEKSLFKMSSDEPNFVGFTK